MATLCDSEHNSVMLTERSITRSCDILCKFKTMWLGSGHKEPSRYSHELIV